MANDDKKKKLSSPSGLDIKRTNNRFVFSWKKGDKDYTDQSLKWSNTLGDDRVLPDSKVGKNTTNKAVSIDFGDFYPHKYKVLIPVYRDKKWTHITKTMYRPKLTSIKFWVRGEKTVNKKTTKSDWAEKTFKVDPPLKPHLSASHSSTYSNSTSFSWGINYGKSDAKSSHNICTHYEYYTLLVKNKNVADGSKIKNWSKASHDITTGTSRTIVEDTPFDNNNSYTRFFKVRALGPNGVSAFAHAKHVYATPKMAKDVTAKMKPTKSKTSSTVYVKWTADVSYDHPIDSVTVQYALATPASTIVDSSDNKKRRIKLSAPTDLSWTDAPGGVVHDTKKDDGISFILDRAIPTDQCLFVRVNTKHDDHVKPTAPKFVKKGYGTLKAPSNLSAEVVGNIATISNITNDSGVTSSFVAIYYRNNLNMDGQIVGIWPSGNSSPISVQLPSPGKATSISFGTQTLVADYSPITPETSGVTSYSIENIQMQSEIVWDDRDVPQPPQISLTSPRSGVVRVSWDWKWTNANGVELSWADHDDAWESTDGPNTYTLTATRASSWNVAGLEVGMWYFRVRLFQTDGEATTYGTYSKQEEIKLSSTPNTPVLTVSPTNVSTSDTVTCYWAYTATDGDEQVGADICEATIDSSGAVTYGTPLYKTNDEQYKTLSVSELGWAAGETHYLAVRVKTASGEVSDNWSIPKAVNVLTPVVATINSSSLVEKTTSIDDQEGTTDTYLSLTNMPLSISASGADSGGKMTYIVERAAPFHMDRPDENDIVGFEEETVAIIEKDANTSYTLSTDTKVDPATTYYTRSGSEEPYTYTEVTNPPSGTNPSTSNYYVLSGYNFDATIGVDDTFIKFDDGGQYNLIAIAEDSYGQTSDPVYLKFIVNWDHQAMTPSASIQAIQDDDVVFITPELPDKYYTATGTEIDEGITYYTASFVTKTTTPVPPIESLYEFSGDGYVPTNDESILDGKTYFIFTAVATPVASDISNYYVKFFPGDTCDIYRLSVDKPELIVRGAEFGTTYVDPYPALGPMGGHRVVYRTYNGDFYTFDNAPAWVDYDEDDGDIITRFATIIDFAGEKIVLPYDISLSTSWDKDFTETRYLGGSVQGDWNPAVSRSSSVKTRVAVEHDPDLIEKMRRLAVYPGVCHVRTPDGSSYSANINVTEDREERKINMVASFSMDITRIDSGGFDGVTYKSWADET